MGFDFLQDLAIVMVVAGLAGWLCHRMGLSVALGYLLAGIVVGPHTTAFTLVGDLERIHTLSQLGMVFLMFSIGMGLTLNRLRRMGPPMGLATLMETLLMFLVGQIAGQALGWNRMETLFLSGILMVSSSAIVSKVLAEVNATHQPAGRLAMGMILIEDVIAVVVLTLLPSASHGAGTATPLWETVGMIAAFIILLVVAGLLLVPRLLARLARNLDSELQTVLIAALLLAVALLTVKAGYSVALGAFLLGAIVSETPQRLQVERYLQGTKDIFTAVFFVSIGMLMDVRLVAQSWHLVLGIGVITLLGRAFATSTALILIGKPTREAVRTGLILTPVGEFSFIIAQLGVAAAAVPPSFYPLAVGVSLFTALTAPVLIRHSAAISQWVEDAEPAFVKELLGFYRRTIDQMHARQQGNLLWQLSRKRLIGIGIGVFFVTGLLRFSRPIYATLAPVVGAGPGGSMEALFPIVFWTLLGTLALAPVVAIWRNLSALSMLFAEIIARGLPQGVMLQGFVERSLQLLSAAAMALWLWVLLPFEFSALWSVAIVVLLLGLLVIGLRQRLVQLHNRLEIKLAETLVGEEEHKRRIERAWMGKHRDWNLNIHEVTLPDNAARAGQSIAELSLRSRFGCSVAGVERNRFPIANPPPDLILYPGDKLLILATAEQIEPAREYLGETQPKESTPQLLDEIVLAAVPVATGSPVAGKLLIELEIPAATGVQIVGIERGEKRLLNPGPFQAIEPGDSLLTLGTQTQIEGFRRWLLQPIAETA